MAEFKKNNNMWTKRSKHGRDKIFQTPQDLWDVFMEYCKHVDNTPLYEHDIKVVDKELQNVSLPRIRPYTVMGFMLFCGTNHTYWSQFKTRTTAGDIGFSSVIDSIENVCYTQKFAGAAAGFFNANIISRDLGLVDKQQSQTVVYNTDITPEEAAKIAKGLEDDY